MFEKGSPCGFEIDGVHLDVGLGFGVQVLGISSKQWLMQETRCEIGHFDFKCRPLAKFIL